MKKILSLFVALIATSALWAGNVITYTASAKLTETTSSSSSGLHKNAFNVSIASHTFSNGIGTITFSGEVTSIGYCAFDGCSDLTSITIPNSVTSIENYAFDYCSGLTSITIPNSVTSIGSHAFQGCKGLTSITIPSSVTSIGNYAFSECSGLTSITIPNSVTSIGDYAFGGCTGLTSITIPNSVTSIGNYAFSNCTHLKSVIIPSSVTSIGKYAFSPCSGLTSIVVESGNSKYDSRDNCNAIIETASNTLIAGCKNTIIPSFVTSIGSYAFCECSGLTSITIPSSVTSIGNYAFYYCSKLTSITIPNSVTSIGESAFRGCSGLTSITIPSSVTSIGEEAFYRCDNLKKVYNASSLDIVKGLKTHGFVAFYADNVYDLRTFSVASSDTLLGTVGVTLDGRTIPNDTTLWTGTNLTLLATPNEHYQFSRWDDGNTNNPRIITTSKNETYTAYFEPNTYVINLSTSSNGGKVFGQTSGKYLDEMTITATPDFGYHFTQWSDGNTENPRNFVLTQDTAFAAEFAIIYSGSCGNDIDWKYSDGTLSISGYGAMYDYSSNTAPWLLFRDSITSLTISENITSIGDYAFYGLQHRAFNQLILPQTVVTIGAYAFAECNRLTNICFGQNLEEIKDYAFYNCARINEMTIYATNAPDIYQNTFAYVSHYAYLFVPCESLRAYQIAAYWNAFDIKCVGAESNVTPIDDVVVTPSNNTVNIVWPKDDAADTYTIVITKEGTTICTLTFNANGQLMNIAFAPSRDGESPAQVAESINGSWSFTVTSLTPATKYDYSVTTKNAAQSVLNTYTGSFTTTGTTPIDNISTELQVEKFLRDGQILIQRGCNTYDLRGQVVK